MDEELGSRTIVEINVTDGDLADIQAPAPPLVGLSTRKISEVADFNKADPATAGTLSIRSSLKHPSPGVPAHSRNGLAKTQGAALSMSKANALNCLPDIARIGAETTLQILDADATIGAISMPGSPSRRAGCGKSRTAPPTNEATGEFGQGLSGTGWELGSNVVPFFGGTGRHLRWHFTPTSPPFTPVQERPAAPWTKKKCTRIAS